MKKIAAILSGVSLLLMALLPACTQRPAGQSDPIGGTNGAADAGLKSISLDGGYSITFSPDTYNYEVKIPDGRPRVARISAEAGEGCTVTITQAVLPDQAESGSGYVTVKGADGKTAQYTITFVRDASLGFHLQYNDYYTIPVEDPSQVASYESSDPDVVYAYNSGAFAGKIHAEGLSETPVTVKALAADGTVLASLVIDKVVKAPLNVFLITGQSNAYGTYDIPANTDGAAFTASQLEQTLKPDPGTVLCTDVSNTGAIQEEMYDLSIGRSGFSPALGRTWYNLTGEKTLMIQTAVGGAPIEAWMKPEGNTRYTYGNNKSNFYETTYNAFQHCLGLINAADSGYELNHVYAYWLQGETGMGSTYNPNKLGAGVGDWDFGSKEHILDSQEYYEIFMKNMEYFEEDFGCEFMGILLVRAIQEVCSPESVQMQLLTDLVPARAAQYALHNSNGTNISIVSRVCDIARMISWGDRTDPGWGLMGSGNLHYNQAGHNENGVQAAINTFGVLYGGEVREAYDIEIIAENGRDRINEGETLGVIAGESSRIAAMVLPMYTDTPIVSYEVADTSVCTVDKYGLITAAADAAGKETTITVKCEAADLAKTVKVKVGAKTVSKISCEWNFDNGDLTEKDGKNNLTVSAKTGNNAAYSITGGIYTATNSLTNFTMEHPVRISSENDWCIEWRGVVNTNSSLFGTAGDWTNFMYIAYSVPFEVVNPMRIVGSDGTAIMIPYGNYASYNTSGMNTWKVEYVVSTNRVSLYLNNTIPVGSVEMPAGWSAEFTNLFGSYFSGVDVDYQGSIDWVRISTTQEQIVY
ncbi:MAG: hypothetical protein J6L24_01310 [Oscillospiraceae bacterium]|nr:hypothetical protein [Oscillospiraceae bacterium]